MRLAALTATPLVIPFTTRFRHASAERTETASLWVEVTSDAGHSGRGESCPRPYVTGETVASALNFVAEHHDSLVANIHDLASLRAWMTIHAAAIDRAPAAWCAVELAVLDLLGRSEGVTLETLLGRPPLTGPFAYTAVIGDGDQESFDRQWARYAAAGFRDVKLKISGERTRDLPRLAVLAATAGLRVRLDANNLWREAGAAIVFLRDVPGPLFAVEEPVAAGDLPSLGQVADATGVPVILDESATTAAQVARLPGPPHRWIVNVRVSKMGGVLRALDVVETARRRGIRVVVGAQVGETSVLTRAALPVAEAAGPALVAMEGGFGTLLLTRDVCDPPLMFGAAGRLAVADHPRLALPGLGIA